MKLAPLVWWHRAGASRRRDVGAALRGAVLGPYVAASVIALALANAVDVAFTPGPRDPAFLLCLVGLLLGLGSLHGLLWQGLQALLLRLPGALAGVCWMSLCLALGGITAERLGGFNRLGGRYHALALIVLALCGAQALVLGAVLAAVQPTRRAPAGRLAALARGKRIAIAIALFVAALLLGYADRVVYADLYPAGHVAMRITSWWFTMLALVVCDAELRLPRLSLRGSAVIALLAAIPLVMLDEHAPRVLQGFGVRAWPSLMLGGARTLVDVDGDGHASLFGGGDCAPLDPRVHPGARETPGNGIDDNCVLGDARRTADDAEVLPPPAGPSPVDLVLITVDALRPDHMGIYNRAYRRKARRTTPAIDRWAKRATIFRRAYTPGAWTSIAIPSLMRGLYPRRLHWTRYFETNRSAMIRKPLKPKLRRREHAERMFPFAYDDAHPSLAQRLQRRGMYTAAVTDDGYSEILRSGTGIERGFDVYREIDQERLSRRNDRGTVDLALDLLERMPPKRRFFLWVHLFGVHGPDEHHPGTRVFGTTAGDLYDHELSYLDEQLGRLLAALERRAASTAVLLTADHGELIYQDTRYHGHSLDETVLRVPLIARVPGWRAGSIDQPVSLVDVVPTALALTRTPTPRTLDGWDLAPLAAGAPRRPRILFSDTWHFEADGRTTKDLVAAYDGERKVVLDRTSQYVLAYDAEGRTLPRAAGLQAGELARASLSYVDETGGELHMRD